MSDVTRLRALFGPLTRAVTYTRWLHMLVGCVVAVICAFITPGYVDVEPVDFWQVLVLPVPVLAGLAMIPSMRLAEGLQARMMLLPGKHARGAAGREGPGRPERAPGAAREIVAAPSASWADRWRTAVWMVLRLEVGCMIAALSVPVPGLSIGLLTSGLTGEAPTDTLIPVTGAHWWYVLLAPLPVLLVLAAVAVTGAGMTAAARRLLGPSPAEQLAALEERTERMLERGRLAGELHDSIGHALTLSVVQAGAARAAGSPEFTERALSAIEESGRHALEDLERVLRLLRDDAPRPSARPGLGDVERLLESARAAGAEVTAELTGPVRGAGRARRDGAGGWNGVGSGAERLDGADRSGGTEQSGGSAWRAGPGREAGPSAGPVRRDRPDCPSGAGGADRPSRNGAGSGAERPDSAQRPGGAEQSAGTAWCAGLPGPVSREGYRIVQEALTNVLRHAGPVPVSVRIAVHRAEVELEIRSQLPPAGVPSDAPAAGCGSGLRGIRERAALLGGRAETGPDGDAWRVGVRLPYAVGRAPRGLSAAAAPLE